MCVMQKLIKDNTTAGNKCIIRKDTRYKMVLLPFHVYNYTHIRRYSHRDMHSI